jgi:hypothetical protein
VNQADYLWPLADRLLYLPAKLLLHLETQMNSNLSAFGLVLVSTLGLLSCSKDKIQLDQWKVSPPQIWVGDKVAVENAGYLPELARVPVDGSFLFPSLAASNSSGSVLKIKTDCASLTLHESQEIILHDRNELPIGTLIPIRLLSQALIKGLSDITCQVEGTATNAIGSQQHFVLKSLVLTDLERVIDSQQRLAGLPNFNIPTEFVKFRHNRLNLVCEHFENSRTIEDRPTDADVHELIHGYIKTGPQKKQKATAATTAEKPFEVENIANAPGMPQLNNGVRLESFNDSRAWFVHQRCQLTIEHLDAPFALPERWISPITPVEFPPTKVSLSGGYSQLNVNPEYIHGSPLFHLAIQNPYSIDLIYSLPKPHRNLIDLQPVYLLPNYGGPIASYAGAYVASSFPAGLFYSFEGPGRTMEYEDRIVIFVPAHTTEIVNFILQTRFWCQKQASPVRSHALPHAPFIGFNFRVSSKFQLLQHPIGEPISAQSTWLVPWPMSLPTSSNSVLDGWLPLQSWLTSNKNWDHPPIRQVLPGLYCHQR